MIFLFRPTPTTGSMCKKLANGLFGDFSPDEPHYSQSSKENLVQDLVGSLTDRFADVTEGVLEATEVVSFDSWPDKEKSNGKKCLLIISY